MATLRRRETWIILGAVVALWIVIGVVRYERAQRSPCPFIDAAPGAPLAGNDRSWAIFTFGQATVDRCWPDR